MKRDLDIITHRPYFIVSFVKSLTNQLYSFRRSGLANKAYDITVNPKKLNLINISAAMRCKMEMRNYFCQNKLGALFHP